MCESCSVQGHFCFVCRPAWRSWPHFLVFPIFSSFLSSIHPPCRGRSHGKQKLVFFWTVCMDDSRVLRSRRKGPGQPDLDAHETPMRSMRVALALLLASGGFNRPAESRACGSSFSGTGSYVSPPYSTEQGGTYRTFTGGSRWREEVRRNLSARSPGRCVEPSDSAEAGREQLHGLRLAFSSRLPTATAMLLVRLRWTEEEWYWRPPASRRSAEAMRV